MTIPQPREAAASIVTYRVGGRDYPLRSAPTCRVCASTERLTVERWIATGRTFATIVANLPTDCDLTVDHVRSHYRNNHMPLEVAAFRQVVEERAAEIGRDIERGVEEMVDEVTLARGVVRRTWEGIVAGDLAPDISDGLAAARLLYQMGADATEVDQSAWTEAFMIYHEIASATMTSEQFERFGRELMANPVLRGLVERQRRKAIDGSKGT